jgi:Fe-S-cluster containining protein
LKRKTCTVYSWRPIACRKYYVTSPASQCMNPFKKNILRVSLAFDARDLLADVAADILG